ncbi:MAG: hydrogenase iron-sulfur subunit [Desulfobacula sp.]|uniref:hydrogenase iron-sulfur subunit n=1 Tax=Desulfobacula sp. TaxID=2593537 RepID=UPI0025B984B7|nr:hydrogenase iron-sulfur subunit [Desulfobacula sp.]MCD4720022.1 hydrogenase iron-sulfur subunit [Desulfobacula sp.]
MTSRFEPVIIGFLCNWCSYTGADLAGVARLQYPPNLRPIRVMCSGMVHPDLVMKAFSAGADGVIILGCHPGACHYVEGNTKAVARADVISMVLGDIGVDPRRFELQWISSAEASVFAQVVTSFTRRIKRLGPYKRKI